MSYKWPDKDKDELLDYSIDWSRFLGSDVVSGVTWYIDDAAGTKTEVNNTDIVDGLQFVQGTNTTTVATIRLSLGTNNKRYKITCKVTTLGGLQYERSVFLRVKEK
jgi:hypothetical protein